MSYFDAVDIQKQADTVLVASALVGITIALADYLPDGHLSDAGFFVSALAGILGLAALSIRMGEGAQMKSVESELDRIGGTD